MVALGPRIILWRERKGWTQAELAYRLGMSAANLCRIEAGNQNVNLLQIEHIADVLKISVGQLLGLSGHLKAS